MSEYTLHLPDVCMLIDIPSMQVFECTGYVNTCLILAAYILPVLTHSIVCNSCITGAISAMHPKCMYAVQLINICTSST